MAPASDMAYLARRSIITAAPVVARHLAERDLTVRGAQGVTLGVIVAYVVGIALLWNLPYVRWVLWPWKVGDWQAYSSCARKSKGTDSWRLDASYRIS